MSGSEVFKAIQLIIGIVNILKKAYEFSKECAKLRDRCDTLQAFLKQNASVLQDEPIIEKLRDKLETIQRYLDSRKEKGFSRNLIFEIMFQKKIPKYREELIEWTMSTILAINVRYSVGRC